jgi:hypothetical protein
MCSAPVRASLVVLVLILVWYAVPLQVGYFLDGWRRLLGGYLRSVGMYVPSLPLGVGWGGEQSDCIWRQLKQCVG